jgi:serine protease AprX
MAASKGILVVNSAGNSGAGAWKFITAPADGHRVLAVGAVGPNRERAWFSSYGPSYDGRVKPNVMAQGHQTVFANMNGGISIGNGTSFSGPIIAGMAACLWQLHPAKTSFEIHDSIEQSAHLYTNPNDSLGHGIPDFWKAHRILKGDNPEEASLELSIFPNPFTDDLRLVFRPGKFERIRLEVFDSTGRLVREFDEVCTIGPYVIHHLGPEMRSLPAGSYILNCLVDGIPYFTKRVLKG